MLSLTLCALFAGFLAVTLPAGEARAQSYDGYSLHAKSDPSYPSQCHATSGMDVTFEAIAASASWDCTNENWVANQPVAWLRFDAQQWDGQSKPLFFYSRSARFEAIEILALDQDGATRSLRHLEWDADQSPTGPMFQLKLPEITEATQSILVRIERPHALPLLTEARLSVHPGHSAWTDGSMMMVALILGMLILPLLFDISFFIVLREKFVAFHAAMVLGMIGFVSFSTGVVSVFINLPLWLVAVAGPLSWAFSASMACLFLLTFFARDRLSGSLRRALAVSSVWTLGVTGFAALQLHATQAFDDQLYFWSFLVAMFVTSAAIIQALSRGSVSARYVAVAWAPILLASAERFLRGLGLYSGPQALDLLIYLAGALEVIVISLAIAARFLAIRLERDAAINEARSLEKLSTQDQLTGLLNRRGIEERFAQLRSEGFDTFALFDLDHFKQVNDLFGHQTGDHALAACADAIRGGEGREHVAVRLGGEEFVVLLRGANALDRAEAMRRMIPVRIARDVEALDRPVTASMGVIELPRESDHLMDFNDLYARADQLLYNAKSAGRNRVCFERLTVFHEPPRERRQTPRQLPKGRNKAA